MYCSFFISSPLLATQAGVRNNQCGVKKQQGSARKRRMVSFSDLFFTLLSAGLPFGGKKKECTVKGGVLRIESAGHTLFSFPYTPQECRSKRKQCMDSYARTTFCVVVIIFLYLLKAGQDNKYFAFLRLYFDVRFLYIYIFLSSQHYTPIRRTPLWG